MNTVGMSTVGFGLIGYGAWGRHHARVIAEGPRTRLVSIADCAEACRAGAQNRPSAGSGCRRYHDLSKREDVQVVSIALPSHLHCEAGRAAGGRQALIMEKPMGLNVAECRSLIDEASVRGLKLAMAHQFRFSSYGARSSSFSRPAPSANCNTR